MPKLIEKPSLIPVPGGKTIEEFFGRVNDQNTALSLARMVSPPGWSEPGQTPDFDEYTLVLKGTLQVETRTETNRVGAGQAILTHRGEWVRYSTPTQEGAEYVAICLPAFSPLTVHRDA